MGKAIDLTGNTYSRLTVVSEALPRVRITRWNCVCKCGTTLVVIGNNLRRGNSTSCGCYKKEVTTTHREHGSRLYYCWRNMLNRCRNPNHTEYHNYGARGIVICSEWADSFDAYKAWSLANGYQDGLTMDRIGDALVYGPNTCRWATATTQARNKRRQTNNTSGFIGVSYYAVGNTYQASVGIDGCPKYVGRFHTAIEAAHARDNYIKENNLTDFTLNFP